MKFYFIMIFLSLQVLLKAQGYLCAIGGGSEDYDDWSDEPYSWIVEKSDSGKIIILSFYDESNWIPDYLLSFGAAEAYNKKINSVSVANLHSTYDELITAKAIFIKGGDQWNYINTWKGTLTEDAINYVFQNGGVIAGTSAGAAVLGEFDFTARFGSAYSDETLIDPFDQSIDIEDNFLNLMPNILFDQHFIERGRFGRLIAMIFNAKFEMGKDIVGVGIDDRTAICIEPNGIGTVKGSGAVAIFYKNNLTNFINDPSGYTIENIKCDQLVASWSYDFNSLEISFIPPSAKNVDTSAIINFPLTDFYVTGNNNITSHLPNLSQFLEKYNSENILVISHPGFSVNLNTLTDYLISQNQNYSVLFLTSEILNNSSAVQQMESADCLIFAGDSLNVLSKLNETSSLLSIAFYNQLENLPIFFFGNSGKISSQNYIDNVDNDYLAGWRGKMTNNNGLSIFGDLIYQPLIFEDSDFYENRTSALLWGLMLNRKKIGIYTDGNELIKIDKDLKNISKEGDLPLIIVDTRNTTLVDSSIYYASSGINPRQVVATNNLNYSITKKNISYKIEEGKFDFTSSVDGNFNDQQTPGFYLYDCYPNPFNPSTNIKYKIISTGFISLKVYDILGNEIATLVNEEKQSGEYQIKFSASNLSNGIYFYKLQQGNYSTTKKLIILK
ncbi:MAG TPA: T9SS type A sorting domain-containing protein [Ignavibacteriaceae bacterium]|nr:T9SS type A sorting domain-containing protein [Ignavibacteriaceae bacterium]